MIVSTRKYANYKPSIDLLVSPIELIESGVIDTLSKKNPDYDCGYSSFIDDITYCDKDIIIAVFRQFYSDAAVTKALRGGKFKDNPILSLFQYRDELDNCESNFSRIYAFERNHHHELPRFFRKVFSEKDTEMHKVTQAELAILKLYLGI